MCNTFESMSNIMDLPSLKNSFIILYHWERQEICVNVHGYRIRKDNTPQSIPLTTPPFGVCKNGDGDPMRGVQWIPMG